MPTQKPFAPSADRNRHAILSVLQQELSDKDRVLEIGSGTGQHICHFAAHQPDIQWFPSDRAEKLPGIRQWITDCACTNINDPLALELGIAAPRLPAVNVCYTANTLHIVSWSLVQALFELAGHLLPSNGKLIVYGPFRFNGDFGTPGNRDFDAHLRQGDPQSGLREVEELETLALEQRFSPSRRVSMPSGNHLLIWQRQHDHDDG